MFHPVGAVRHYVEPNGGPLSRYKPMVAEALTGEWGPMSPADIDDLNSLVFGL